MNKIKTILLMASMVFAVIFTFSCSSDDESGGGGGSYSSGETQGSVSSSSFDEAGSSSSAPPSSSSIEPLTCGSVPDLGYATIPITPPILTCGNGGTATSIRWLGSPAINWNNPSGGTYSGISVMANCGTATDLIASCPGTLTVQPMISCSMANIGYEGTAINQPVLACSDGSEPFDIVLSGYLPNWDNPAVGNYAVLAEANCGQGALPKISCGTLTVNPVTLTCGSVAVSGFEGTEINPPSLTCSYGTLGTPTWENAPDWSNPTPGTYNDISTTATCGLVTKTANCSGTLTVSPLLTCGSLPASGLLISGTAIAPPALACNNGKTATDIIWSGAPNWSNPVGGTYSNVGATATCGTSSGLTANCSGSMQVYKTVAIGTQTWMAENLNYDPGTGNSVCYNNRPSNCAICYDNQASNCITYGRLYNWSTAMNLDSNCNFSSCSNQIGAKHRGVCPAGWHIPSDAEWTTLTDYVGSSTAGTKLKAKSGWNSCGPSVYGNYYSCEDTYGFSALPGGSYSSGSFGNVGSLGFWWGATEFSANYAANRYMHYSNILVERYDIFKAELLSVRCVQD